MLRTQRSPLKSTGDSGNHLDVTNESLEGFPPALKKTLSLGGPPASSGLPVPVARAVPVIQNENKVTISSYLKFVVFAVFGICRGYVPKI